MSIPKTSVLIVNYNYDKYISEAIHSVLNQSQKVDQIIVVDDGSTDNSRAVIEDILKHHPHAELINKENGGQLSAYQAGVPALSGDIIFFLDSDDRWKDNHIASFLEVFNNHPEVDYVYSGHDTFGQRKKAWHAYKHSHYLGMSPLSATYNKSFFGTSPSACAIRKSTLFQIFPLTDPTLLEQRYYADDVIVRGTSILGAIKYYQYPPTTEYRIHGSNEYSGKKRTQLERYRLLLATNRLIEYFRLQAKIDERCCLDFQKEFMTMPKPTKADYNQALKTLGRFPINFIQWLNIRLKLFNHYRKNGR